MVKPLARKQARLTKRIQTGGPFPAGRVGATEPDDAMVDSPLQTLLKKIIQKQVRPPSAVPSPAAQPGPSS